MHTFQPNLSQFHATIIITIVFLILLVFFYFWLSKNARIEAKRKQMLNLLLSMLGLIGIGTLLFMMMSIWKVTPVVVSVSGIQTPYGNARYENIEKITFHEEGLNNRVQRILIIQEKNNGQLHTLSERMYPIDSIFSAAKRIIGD